MAENRKNEQIKGFFIKSTTNWLKHKFLERTEQGPVNTFTPHYPQQVYRQSYRQNFRPQNQEYQQNYRQYQPIYLNSSQTIGLSNSTSPVLTITESLDHNIMLLDHFITRNSHKLKIIGVNLQIAPIYSPILC